MNNMKKQGRQAIAAGRHTGDLAKLGRSKQRPYRELRPADSLTDRWRPKHFNLPKRARVANFFAVIGGVNFHGTAHLV
jgi:hypothetical protein